VKLSEVGSDAAVGANEEVVPMSELRLGTPPVPIKESADGRPVIQSSAVWLAAGENFYYSRGDALGFRVYSRAGRLERDVRVLRERVPVPGWRKPDWEQSDLVPFLPEVMQLTKDDAGRIWVRSQEAASSAELRLVWFVFRPDGSLEARVVAAQPVALLAVRGNSALTVRGNSDGVPQVELYSIRRP
jgi:hypothetical protein